MAQKIKKFRDRRSKELIPFIEYHITGENKKEMIDFCPDQIYEDNGKLLFLTDQKNPTSGDQLSLPIRKGDIVAKHSDKYRLYDGVTFFETYKDSIIE